MATIYELAQMSGNAYSGTSDPNQNTGPGSPLLAGLSNWEVLQTSSAADPAFWGQGYFGVAYYNAVTHEVVIANRGTDFGDGVNTAYQDLLSDAALGKGRPSQGQSDAVVFAEQIASQLQSGGIQVDSLIETGHSLGGAEAQTAVAALVDDPRHEVPSADVSGVVFNSPGIGNYPVLNSPTSYNVVSFYDQGDAIHATGGAHLGATGSSIMLSAGPDTSQLVALAPTAVAAGPPGILALLGAALYDVLGPAHSINTVIQYLAPSGGGDSIGGFNWVSTSSASSISGAPVNPALPAFSVNANGDVVLTDPSSGIATTLSLSSDSQSLVGVFSGGSSAVAQALSALGSVSIPLSEFGQSLGGLTSASLVAESISRNTGGSFDVAFQGSTSGVDPGVADEFLVRASNAENAFDYVIPGSGQTLIETIDNGADNATGSIAVLGASVTQLTGGEPVAGEGDTWVDSSGDQYSFVPVGEGSESGTLTISQGLFGNTGNQIIINDFNLTAASAAPGGYLGIHFAERLLLAAGATVGTSSAAGFPSGSDQSYTLAVDAPNASAQTITLTLSGADASDFQAVIDGNLVPLSAQGSFTVTLPAGETNVSYGLLNVSALPSDTTLVLNASMSNPAGGAPIASTPLDIDYQAAPPDTASAPDPTDDIVGGYRPPPASPTTMFFSGDGGNDYIAATVPDNIILAGNSVDDSITGGSGSNSIYGGTGHDVIDLGGTGDWVVLGGGYNTVNGGVGDETIIGQDAPASPGDDIIIGNGGNDSVLAGNGSNQIFAGSQSDVATAISTLKGSSASGQQGDLLTALDGNNTIVGGTGNDFVGVGTGNNVVVLGPGDDTFNGGIEITDAQDVWTVSASASVISEPDVDEIVFSENLDNFYYTFEDFTDPNPQPDTRGEVGAGNDTVFAGSGNDYLFLAAGIDIEPGQRAKLERLCRYVSRPPVALERLALRASGHVRYRLKTPYRDGTTHIVLEPLDLMGRLAALVPPPRMHLTRFHGVFAPHSKWRAAVTPAHRGVGAPQAPVGPGEPERPLMPPHVAMTWAQRLKRVFAVELEACARCGGKLQIIASIEEPELIAKILSHLERVAPDQYQPELPLGARAPPQQGRLL